MNLTQDADRSCLASTIESNPFTGSSEDTNMPGVRLFGSYEVIQSADLWNYAEHRPSPATNRVMHRVGFQSRCNDGSE